MTIPSELKKNEIYPARITGYTSEGAGVCRIGDRAVFVPGTIVGEEWDVRIVRSTSAAVWGRGETLRSLTLEVLDSNAPAAALYASLGFAQIGLRKNYYQHPKEDARILRKELL